MNETELIKEIIETRHKLNRITSIVELILKKNTKSVILPTEEEMENLEERELLLLIERFPRMVSRKTQ